LQSREPGDIGPVVGLMPVSRPDTAGARRCLRLTRRMPADGAGLARRSEVPGLPELVTRHWRTRISSLSVISRYGSISPLYGRARSGGRYAYRGCAGAGSPSALRRAGMRSDTIRRLPPSCSIRRSSRRGAAAAPVDDMILSLCTRGMTIRDIHVRLPEVYGADVSPALVSKVTDPVAVVACGLGPDLRRPPSPTLPESGRCAGWNRASRD
jgi:mutator family transposase